MSEAGSTRPSTCTTSSSAKTRTTWQIASASRMLARNLLPRPSPSLAPLTMPAMSTNDTVAGRMRSEPKILASSSQPRIGQRDDADVGLDRRERVVRGQHVVAGQRVEEGGLADVGQSDDSEGKAHGRVDSTASASDQRPSASLAEVLLFAYEWRTTRSHTAMT